MHQKRRRLAFSDARFRPPVQQIKYACTSMRQNRRASQLKKRPRILPHAFDPTLFICRLEIPCRAHRKEITHGRLLNRIRLVPDEPEPPKTKAAHVADCEPLNFKMVASKSFSSSDAVPKLEQSEAHLNRY